MLNKTLNNHSMRNICFIASLFYLSVNYAYGSKIICDFNLNNEQNQLIIKLDDDIYHFYKINLSERFRVSGQYLSQQNKFKLYVYTFSKERYVLLNAQEFVLSKDICSRDFGRNRVYGDIRERELIMQCIQVCED